MVTLFDKLLFSGVMLLFALFGVGIIKFGRMMAEPVRAMEAEETTPVADLAAGGTAEVRGTVRAAGEGTVESPLYGRKAVDAVTEVQRRTDGGEASPGWSTRHEDRTRVPFLVADDTGEVRVEPPPDATPTVPMEWERFGAGAEASETVREYLSTVDAGAPDAGIDVGPVSVGSRQRCGEGTLEPGDEAVVYGRAVEAPADPDGPAVALTGGDGTHFVYSTVDEADLAASTSKLVLMIYAFGALWIAFTLFAGIVPWVAG